MEILSKEMIKPASPTPNHFRSHKLSFLDQIASPVYIPLVFFYQSDNFTKKSELLKQSLSTILVQYYPLAGRINGDLSIDCNDAGVEYVETRVHVQLAHVITEPTMEERELKRYLPKENCRVDDIPLSIQVNFFACGGIAIGVCISHKVADGSSLATFMNSWAAKCRGHDAAVVQQAMFDSTTLFPAKHNAPGGFSSVQHIGITNEKIVAKRFVFDKEKLTNLKKSAASDEVKDPTRVEVVTAFMWKHFINGKNEKKVTLDNKKKSYAAVHAVSLRPRMVPPLPEHSFGNIFWYAQAVSNPETHDDSFRSLVGKLRTAIRKINDEYIKKMQGDEFFTFLRKAMELYFDEDTESYSFTSWSSFGLYEVDYGWGKPTWVCTSAFPFKNLVILMSTRCGEGIEAWVNMVEDDDHDDNVVMIQSDLKKLSLDVSDEYRNLR